MIIKKKKKLRRSSSNSGYKIQKYMWRDIYSRTLTFGAELHKSQIEVKRWHNKYKILNYIKRQNFFLNYLLTKSNRTELQTYRVEERTFGTPRITVL